MSAKTIVVEVYALSEMSTSLRKLSVSVSEATHEQEQAIAKRAQELSDKVDHAQQALSAAIQAYNACRGEVDEEGNRPPCSAEAAAVTEAQTDLEHAQQCQASFNDAISQFRETTSHLTNSINERVQGARGDLTQRIEKILEYLKANPVDPRLMESWKPGAANHGSAYQRARREWYERGAAGEYPEMGSDDIGWMKNELRRGSTRSPGSRGTADDTRPAIRSTYDLGHDIAGIHIPENFRGFEMARYNRRRAARGRALGIHPMFW